MAKEVFDQNEADEKGSSANLRELRPFILEIFKEANDAKLWDLLKPSFVLLKNANKKTKKKDVQNNAKITDVMTNHAWDNKRKEVDNEMYEQKIKSQETKKWKKRT